MIDVLQIDKVTWADSMSSNAHKICFAELMPGGRERLDYALLMIETAIDKPAGYVTVRETDSETAHWQFGGAFPLAAKRPVVWKAYLAAIMWSLERYERITTVIEASNVTYLKMALTAGFRIVGTRVYEGKCLVEMLMKKEIRECFPLS